MSKCDHAMSTFAECSGEVKERVLGKRNCCSEEKADLCDAHYNEFLSRVQAKDAGTVNS